MKFIDIENKEYRKKEVIERFSYRLTIKKNLYRKETK